MKWIQVKGVLTYVKEMKLRFQAVINEVQYCMIITEQ